MRNVYVVIVSLTLLVHTTDCQWRNSTIIGGGATVLALGSRNDTLFALADGSFFRSTDSGNDWNALSSVSASVLAFSGSSIYAGSDGSGVFLSSDNGLTWIPKNNGLANIAFIRTLAINGSTLFAGAINYFQRFGSATGCIYSSTDNGDDWNVPGLVGLDVNILFTRNAKIYAGTSNGVYVSSNNGATWDSLNVGLSKISITALAASTQKIFAGDIHSNIYASTDEGTSWNKIATLPPDTINYVFSCTLFSWKNRLYAGTGSGIFVSTNDGESWTNMNSGLANHNISCFIGNDTMLLAGTRGKGVFATDSSNADWQLKSKGLTGIPETYAFLKIGDDLFVGTYGQGVFDSKDGGVTWYTILPSPTYITSLAYNGSNVVAGSPDGLFLSKDTCSTWQNSYNGPWTLANTSSRILGVVGTTFYASFNDGFFASADGGLTWNPSSLWGEYGAWIKAFTNTGQTFIVGTWDGAYRSTNNGIDWNAVNNGIDSTYGLNINALATSNNNIFLGAWGVGMFASTNNGSSWNEINNGLTNLFVQCLTIRGSDVFVGTDGGGVFHSSDSGLHWESINTNLSNFNIESLYITDNTIYAGSSSGVFYRPVSEVTSVKRDNSDTPEQFALFQNYPNPFNPSTAIAFELPRQSRVMLTIYDVLGRTVAILVNRELPAGTHVQQWNAEYFPSGVYFYRLQAGTVSETKKLTVLK